jgi:hypothetical protein
MAAESDLPSEEELVLALSVLRTELTWAASVRARSAPSLGKFRLGSKPELEELLAAIGSSILDTKAKTEAYVEQLKEVMNVALRTKFMRAMLLNILAEFTNEIKTILCGSKSRSSLAKTGIIGAQVAALSQFLAAHLGLGPAAALGLATMVVSVLSHSIQTTFCKMLQPEIKAWIAARHSELNETPKGKAK